MTIFQLIKTVLDEVYLQIDAKGENDRDLLISEQVKYLTRQYKKLLFSKESIDYKNPATRFAYIFKYVTCHANLVYNQIFNISELFNQSKMMVSCIGGGPGSDLLGILKFLLKQRKTPHLRCFILDREEVWSDSWCDVDDKLNVDFRISTHFERLDITNMNSWIHKTKYLDSDLYTLIYFMSEIHKNKDDADEFFDALFTKAKNGAKFLYIDNNHPEFYSRIDLFAQKYKLKILKSEHGHFPINDCLEEKKDLKEYFEKFGDPKLKPDVAIRIFEKI